MPSESADPRFEVRRAELADFERIYDAVDDAFEVKRPREMYDWLYRKCPLGPARCWLLVEKATEVVVNVAGRVSWPLARGDQPLEGAIVADNATIPRYQRQGQGLGELRGQGTPVAPTFLFVAGYVAMWCLFSVGATAAQWALERAALLSPNMVATSPGLGAVLLGAAGIYQLTPAKDACLRHCRSPAYFLSEHWRPGMAGAFRMGIVHGAWCLGCCWILMALLFVGGVMNLLWVAAIALFVLLEKALPLGDRGGRLAG